MPSCAGPHADQGLNLYDALVARFGVAADERFATVLNGITKERQRRKRQPYNAAYRARKAAYMRGYWAGVQ